MTEAGFINFDVRGVTELAESVYPSVSRECGRFPENAVNTIKDHSHPCIKENEAAIDATLCGSESLLICIYCDKVFQALNVLSIHMRLHRQPGKNSAVDEEGSDESCQQWTSSITKRSHVCPECGRAFSQSCNLKMHRRTHTGVRPFACAICGLAFASKINMQTHERTHSGARPFACEKCSKLFTQGSSLRVHMRSHTGERPYSCEQCGRQFVKFSDCQRHARTHASVRPHACAHCRRTFADPTSLTLHARRHVNERPYVCFVCDKRFTRVSCLKSHIQRHTRRDVIDDVASEMVDGDGPILDA